MVLHLDPASGTCRVLSIPRDTRTELPGYGLTKINHALAVGGIDYEKLVVQNLLGLKINHYVLIDFNGFEGLVDAVGGVTIDVPAGFTATDGTTFVAGAQSMSGRQALSYARFRGGPDGDFGRINRQQQVIRALVARASGLNIVRSLNELLPAVAENLRTDLSARDMAALASDYRSRCTDQNVTMLSLDGTIATYQDPLLNLPLSYVVVDPSEIKAKVAELLDH
jgi:LCP family protein required for cell wall assembly